MSSPARPSAARQPREFRQIEAEGTGAEICVSCGTQFVKADLPGSIPILRPRRCEGGRRTGGPENKLNGVLVANSSPGERQVRPVENCPAGWHRATQEHPKAMLRVPLPVKLKARWECSRESCSVNRSAGPPVPLVVARASACRPAFSAVPASGQLESSGIRSA